MKVSELRKLLAQADPDTEVVLRHVDKYDFVTILPLRHADKEAPQHPGQFVLTSWPWHNVKQEDGTWKPTLL